MKTIKKGTEYKRISDREAITLVESKGWSYCAKQEWKLQVRDINKKAEVIAESTETQVETKKKSKKNGK